MGATGSAPAVGGKIDYNARGLPSHIGLEIDTVTYPIIHELEYTRDGLVGRIEYGDGVANVRPPTVSTTLYDDRRRPVSMRTVRGPTDSDPMSDSLSAVSLPVDTIYQWDAANNLIGTLDIRPHEEWPNWLQVGARRDSARRALPSGGRRLRVPRSGGLEQLRRRDRLARRAHAQQR